MLDSEASNIKRFNGATGAWVATIGRPGAGNGNFTRGWGRSWAGPFGLIGWMAVDGWIVELGPAHQSMMPDPCMHCCRCCRAAAAASLTLPPWPPPPPLPPPRLLLLLLHALAAADVARGRPFASRRPVVSNSLVGHQRHAVHHRRACKRGAGAEAGASAVSATAVGGRVGGWVGCRRAQDEPAQLSV